MSDPSLSMTRKGGRARATADMSVRRRNQEMIGMKEGKFGFVRNMMFMVALLAVITLGFMAVDSEDVYANQSGIVKSGDSPVGTYEFDADSGLLTIISDAMDSKVTSISLEGFDQNSQNQVKKIVIKGFVKNLDSLFENYELLDSDITYTGTRTVKDPNDDNTTFRYTYSSLTKKLTISNESGTRLFHNYNSGNDKTIFNETNYFFVPLVESIELKDYQSGGNYLFYDNFKKAESIVLKDYNVINDALLSTMPVLKYVCYDVLTGGVGGITKSIIPGSVSQHIEVVELKSAVKIADGAFKYESNSSPYKNRNSKLTELIIPNVNAIGNDVFNSCPNLAKVTFGTNVTIGSSAFSGCIALVDINGQYITTLGASAFSGCTKLVTFNASSMKEVGNSSFDGCTSLTTVSFGVNVQIGNSVFSGCQKLSEISEEYIVKIGDDAFKNCISLTEDLDFENLSSINMTMDTSPFSGSGITSVSLGSMISLPENVFNGCTTLTSISVKSVTLVSANAFKGCFNLKTVEFGKGVQIKSSAFSDCRNLATISAEFITSIADDSFKGCSLLTSPLNFDSLTSISLSLSNDVSPFSGSGITAVYMPNIKSMSPYAFAGCTNLITVSLGTLVTIPEAAFKGCSNLANIGSFEFGAEVPDDNDIPLTVTSIGNSAFEGTKLSNIDLNNVTSVGNRAFINCLNLSSLDEVSALGSIGENAFENSVLSCDLSFGSSLSSIGQYAFSNTGVTSVTIVAHSESLTVSIGAYAFNKCVSLTSIDMGSSVSSVAQNAFYLCTSLTTLSNIDGLMSIGDSAFENSGLSGSLTFPSDVGSIGASAFKGTNLGSVSFDDGTEITSISDSAFENCSSLLSVNLPSSIKSLGNSVFRGCETLRGSYVDSAYVALVFPANLKTLGDYVFDACMDLLPLDFKNLPVTSIGDYCFQGCDSIVTLELPIGLTSLGEGTFSDCTSLVNIDMSTASGISGVSDYCFISCDSLKSVVISTNITSIGAGAFKDCVQLETVAWHNGLLSIGESAFKGSSIKNSVIIGNEPTGTLVFPSSLQTIGKSAFDNCDGISCIITLPKTLTILGQKAFYDCDYITGLSFSDGSVLTEIGAQSFENCDRLDGTIDFPTSIQYLRADCFRNCKNLDAITFDTVNPKLLGIEEGCFNYCTSLTGALVFPSTLKYIGYCDGLPNIVGDKDANGPFTQVKITSVTFGSSLEAIGKYAFYQCKSMAGNGDGSLTIPDTVTSVGFQAFYDCDKITCVKIGSSSLLSKLNENAFQNSNYIASIVSSVSPESPVRLTLYSSTFSGCSALLEITLPNLDSVPDNTFDPCTKLKVLNIPSVTSLPKGAIDKCTALETISTGTSTLDAGFFKDSYPKLKEVTLTKATSVGNNAFIGCGLLERFTAPLVVTIGSDVFSGCSNLEKVTAPLLKDIGSGCFNGCSSLSDVNKDGDTEIKLSNVTYIGERAFEGCSSLLTVDLASVTALPVYTFNGCSSMDAINIPKITVVAERTFSGCSSLVTAKMGTLTSVGDYAFYGCKELDSISDFGSITAVGNYAFHGCEDLGEKLSENTITLTSIRNIGTSSFTGCSTVTKFVLGSTISTIGDQALNNPNLATIVINGESANYCVENNILFNKSKTELILCPAKSSEFTTNKTYTIPDTVKRIHPYAFQYAALTGIVFSNEVTDLQIGNYAFDSTSLDGTLTFPENRIKSIGNYAFANCLSLDGFKITSSASITFGSNIFYGCTALVKAYIPITMGYVTAEGDPVLGVSLPITQYTFIGQGDSKLDTGYYSTNNSKLPWYHESGDISVSVVFNSGITSIDAYMFAVSGNGIPVVTSLSMGNTVTTIGVSAFKGCSSMTSLTLSKGLVDGKLSGLPFEGCDSISTVYAPVTVDFTELGAFPTDIDKITFQAGNASGVGVDYDPSSKNSLLWANSSSFTVVIDNGVTHIGSYMYLPASKTLVIPSDMRSIGARAFYGASIQTLTISEGLTTIGNEAFGSCNNLETLALPNSLTEFDGASCSPFRDCINLLTVTLPITVDYSMPLFDGCSKLSTFAFTKGTDGKGHGYDETSSKATPWYSICYTKDFSVTFGEGILSIGDYMFAGCYRTDSPYGRFGVTGTITFLKSLADIGAHAFDGCEGVSGFEFGANVSDIGDYAFRGCVGLSSFSVSSALTIGSGAFQGCTGLKILTIPIYVDAVGEGATPIFDGCSGITTINLTGDGELEGEDYNGKYQGTPWYYSSNKDSAGSGVTIVLNSGIIDIGDYMFYGCSKLTLGSLTVSSSGIKAIGTHAFDGVSNLGSLTISDLNVTVNDGAFQDCTGLKTLTLPIKFNSVRNGSDAIFEGCTGITTVNFTGTNNDVGHIYTVDGISNYTKTPWYQTEEDCTINFGANIVGIGAYTFCGCDNIDEFTGTGALTAVGDYAFAGCTSLKAFTGNTIQILGNNAFDGCTSLGKNASTVSFTSVTDVPQYAFRGCTSLTKVDLGTVDIIGDYAFQGSGIKQIGNADNTITLPSVTSIGNYAFAQSGIVNVVIGVQNDEGSLTVGDHVFLECKNLVSVTIYKELANLPYNTFRTATAANFTSNLRSIYLPKTKVFSAYLADCFRNLETVNIPEAKLYEDTTGMFKGCVSLNSMTLPSAEIVLPASAFEGCTSLASIDASKFVLENGREFFGCTALNNVTLETASVSEYAFYGCVGLNMITASSVTSVGAYSFAGTSLSTIGTHFPALTTIGNFAFSDCIKMESIVIPDTIVTFGNSVFSGCTKLTTISMPITLDYSQNVFMGCTSLVNFTFTPGVGDDKGIGSDYTAESVLLTPWYVNSSGVTPITISFSGDVKHIGEYMFYGCTGLNGILTLSSSITGIGAYAFSGVTKVTTLNIQTNSVSFGAGVFQGCINLTTITVPITSDVIVNSTDPVFESCTKIENITFSGNGGSMDYTEGGKASYTLTPWYFSRANTITVSFGAGVTGIGNNMFRDCTGLDGLISSSNLRTVGDYAFYGCTSLDGFSATALITVGVSAFEGDIYLNNVNLGDVVTLSDRVFYGCGRLVNLRMDDCTYIGVSAFQSSGIRNIGEGAGADLGKVTTVKKNAFAGSSVQAVTIGDAESTLSLEGGVFLECPGLTSLTINSSLVSLPRGTFVSESGQSEFRSILETLIVPRTKAIAAVFTDFGALTTVDISGATYFNVQTTEGMFKGCVSLTNVTLCSDVNTSIELPASAFEGCKMLNSINLQRVTFGSGGSEFRGCTSLTVVDLQAATTLPQYAFYGCTSLRTVNAPVLDSIGVYAFATSGLMTVGTSDADSFVKVNSVGMNAFEGCTRLSSVSLPAATIIGEYAFRDCTSLSTVSLPKLKEITIGMFYQCTALSSVTSGASSVRKHAFYKCTSLASISLPSVRTIGELSVPSSVTLDDFEDYVVFYDCKSLTTVHMGKSQDSQVDISVGAFAFYGCTSLRYFNSNASYDLSNAESIGFAAFSSSGVVDVVVGKENGIQTIGDYAFYACSGLKNFTSVSLEVLPQHLFNDSDVSKNSAVPYLATLTVPAVEDFLANLHGCTYLTTVDASSATEFEPNTFYGCSNLEKVSLPGEGSSEIVMLSTGMFYGCAKLKDIDLTKVDFSGSLFDTPADTFYGCKALTEVSLPSTTRIPSGAFSGCIAITSVSAPNVQSIGCDAFAGCIGLKTADVLNVTVLYDRAFKGCSSLVNLNPSIEGSPFMYIADIRTEAFYDCAFTSVVLGSNLITLGDRAFAENPISSLVLPNAPKSRLLMVSEGAFQGCPLEEIHISSSVNIIESYAFDFSGQRNVQEVDVYFNGSLSNVAFRQNAFIGNDRATINFHADSLSSSYVTKMGSAGYLSRADYTYHEEYRATIYLQTDKVGIPVVTNMTAVYGGKVVLPLIEVGDSTEVYRFAILDSGFNLLAVFGSDVDFTVANVARSGDAVSVYPLSESDTLSLVGSESAEGFDLEMTIVTYSSGAEVDITEQKVHYGEVVIVPSFRDTLLNVNSLYVTLADGTIFTMDSSVRSFMAGRYISQVSIISEDMTIDVIFVRDKVNHVAEVNLQGEFNVPDELKYLENAPAGYMFGGWWTSEGGKGIMAGENTRFGVGQIWYAYFVPLEFKITVESLKPAYSDGVTVTGPFTLHVVNGSLYYTDLNNVTNVLIFDAKGIPGYSVSSYMDDGSMKPITGDYGALTTDIVVDLYMAENKYDLELKFMYDGAYIPANENFSILGWEVGAGTSFHTGSTVEDIPYRMIENGLIMPVPVHDSYAFTSMTCAAGSVPYRNGNYVLTLDSFNGALSMEIVYVMQKDMYTIQFQLQDDLDSSYNNYESIAVGQTFMMPSVDLKYFKTGYLFSHLEVAGSDVRYQERQSVTLTQEMADMAKYCVVVVRAVWESESYTIGFDLAPYKGTLDAIEGVTVGKEIALPAVTGYSGYRVSGWHWYSAVGVSDSFEGKVVLTQDVVRDYADGKNIVLQVEWTAKTYSLDVDSSTGYKFETKTATFGEDFTLWTNTYNRSFMKFAGWSIGTTLYKDSSTVRLDSVMAAAGDANNDRIVFSMSWIDNEYQVQYNLDGGEGQIPVDDNAYVVNRSEFKLAGNDGEFYQDGYTFVGWKYSKSSYIVYTNTTGLFETVLAQYADENNIVTFYAVWSQKSYKISYDLAGGRAGLNSPTNVFYGDVVDVSKPTRAGYDFAGWTATGLTGGALYSSSAGYRGWDGNTRVTSTMFMDLCNQDGGVVTFTAHWEQATYLVSYNLNGGTGVIIGGQIQIRVGDVIQQPDLRDAFKTGYRYVGWGVDKVNALSVGSTFSADMISDVGNTLVLYAIWSPIEYTVQHRYIDSYAFTTVTVEFEEILPLPALDRPGYTFKGWKITGADSNAYYSRDGSTWYKIGTTDVEGMYFRNLTSVDGGIVTMEASWSTNEYRISYNSNGGTGKAPVDTNLYKVGDTVQLHDYTVLSGTNGSKSIVGWSLEPNGSSVIISEFTEGLAMQADATGAVNLYAVWVDGMCTVIVDLGDATVNEAPSGWTLNANGTYEKIVDYGSDTRNVMKDWEDVTVEKDGYNFTGWDYGSATITSTVTVEPKFEEVNMTILYAFGGVVAAFAIGAIFFTRL